MGNPFFINRIYFETSFELPQEIQKEDLQDAINQATTSHFSIFLSTIDEEHACINKESVKSSLCLEDISGETIQDLHQIIIDTCREDVINAFRVFFATDSNGSHYWIIHAHHGVADGFMITSFAQSVYATLHGEEPFPLQFVDADTIIKHENIAYPTSWDPLDVKKSIKQTLSTMEQPTVCPHHENGNSHFVNSSRIIDSAISKRASTAAKNYGSIHGVNSCIHGMLLECYLRSMCNEEHLSEGTMRIYTITNLRRYLKPSNETPNLFVSSFPTTVSLPALLSREENCATIQQKVSTSLNAGLPLAIFLNDASVEAETPRVEMEISNLGLHPQNCFTRCLITQMIYANQGVATTSVVVWTDCERRIHLCGACDEVFMKKDRFERFLDGFVRELDDFGKV